MSGVDAWGGIAPLARYRYEETEAEVAEELATALGRSGDRLQRAIDEHAELVAAGAADALVAAALRDVGSALYGLSLQREAMGFVHGNHAWIAAASDLPTGAWRYA